MWCVLRRGKRRAGRAVAQRTPGGWRLELRRATGQAIERDRKSDCDWREFAFPTRWYYDVLWGLDYLRKAGASPDGRTAEAIDLVVARQRRGGRWPLGEAHAGEAHFDMESGSATASRWNTLRALRVLDWVSPTRR